MSLNPRTGTFILSAGMLLPFAGCATQARPDPGIDAIGAAQASVINAQDGAVTQLLQGQLLAIELDSNASTGYRWEIVEDGRPMLEPAPVPARAQPAVPPLPGTGGTSRWRFRAVQSGATTVRLVYRRAWQKDVEPARTAVYRVVVE